MNVVRRIYERLGKGLFGVTFGVPGANTWDYANRWQLGLPTIDTGALEQPYAQHAVISSAIAIKSEDAASVGWELYPEGGPDDEDVIETHPVLDVLHNPGPRMTGHQLWVGTFVSYSLYGEAWWYYPDLRLGTRGGLRATAKSSGEIMLLDPRCIKRDTTGSKPRWVLVVGGQQHDLDDRRLTQFRRHNPYNAWRGLSEIASVILEAEGDHAAARYNRGFFADQSGVPAGLFLPSETDQSNPEDRKAFGDRWNQMHTSMKRRVGIAPPGWKWQDIGVTQKDMEFGSLRSYSRELILSVIGVPPFFAGVLDKANYANAREQKEVYWLGTITRLLTGFQATLNADFLPKIGVAGVELWPAWERVKSLTENLNEKMDVAGKLFAIGFTKRQINERLELGFDVDELEDADTGYLPFNVVPVSLVLNPPEPQPVDDAPPDDDEPKNGNGKALVRATRNGNPREEHRRALVWRNIIVRTRDIENRFNAGLRRHMNEIREESLAYVNGLKGWLASQTKQDEHSPFDVEAAMRRLMAMAQPLHRAALVRGGESVLADMASALDFESSDPNVLAKLAELTHKITRIDATIERALRDNLVEGLSLGESPQELAARVRQTMDASMARSMTIARTETGFAFNTGRNIGMKQAGVERHEWLTARDPRVRDTHQAEDGVVVPIGEPFPTTKLLYPLDPAGPPGELVNCRCVAIPVVTGG